MGRPKKEVCEQLIAENSQPIENKKALKEANRIAEKVRTLICNPTALQEVQLEMLRTNIYLKKAAEAELMESSLLLDRGNGTLGKNPLLDVIVQAETKILAVIRLLKPDAADSEGAMAFEDFLTK